MHYAIVVEKTEHNYSAYVPDLRGCMATGQTVKEVENEIAQPLSFISKGFVKTVWTSRSPSVEYIEVKA